MDFLDDDSLSVVITYLRPIDIISLSFVNKRYNIYKINFLELITKYLKERLPSTITPEEFLSLTRKSGGHISGSVILQLLYDEIWENSDLDIIIPTTFPFSNNGEFTYDGRDARSFDDPSFILGKHCLTNEFTKETQDCSDQLLCIHWKDQYANYKKKSYGLIPANMYKFTYNKFDINFIYIENMQTYEYIDYYFDFSVCKNMYDGIKLTIWDIEGIISRKTKNNTDYSRYRQIVNHSYDGWNKKDSLKIIEEQSKKRKDKYIKRGFKIVE
jgi:hypothetical protein